MKNIKLFSKILFFLGGLLLASQSFGQNLTDHFIPNQLVVEGKVVQKKGYWSKDKKMLYTVNWFKINRVFNGQINSDSIPVITLGGQTENELVVVDHTYFFNETSKYLMTLDPCLDCIDEFLVYQPSNIAPEFQPAYYRQKRQEYVNQAKQGSVENIDCKNDKSNFSELFLSFSNLNLISDPNSNSSLQQGYIDLKTKTSGDQKALYNLAANLKYDVGIFGDYAVTNQNISIEPANQNLVTSYNNVSNDIASDEAIFSMTKNLSPGGIILIDNFEQSTVRIHFTLTEDYLSLLPPNLSDILRVLDLSASFYCEGEIIPFDKITVVDTPIGIDTDSNVAGGVTYTFENVKRLESINKYQFDVYISSTEETYLTVADLKISYSNLAFLPFQVGDNHISVLSFESPNPTISSIYDEDIYTATTQDLQADLFHLVISSSPGVTLSELGAINNTPRFLVRVTLALDDCTEDPELGFLEEDMQEFNLHTTDFDYPNPVVYEPVEALDFENTPVCGCDGDGPIIGSFTSDPFEANFDGEYVAGDNQVLTISGWNFGVWKRGDPSDGGDGSSVLFTNGNDFSLPGSPNEEFIAAGTFDFRNDEGILFWDDNTIKVRVPSTDYASGTTNPAGTGKIKIRNGCNQTTESPEKLKVRYALRNHRAVNETAAKKLGLRNNDGEGYVFQYKGGPMSDGGVPSNVRTQFKDALDTWCSATNIRFSISEEETMALQTAGDGVNSISVENIGSDPNALASNTSGVAYFEIKCNASGLDIFDYNGGYILKELDFKITPNFASNGSSSDIQHAFEHELGHAHQLDHARNINGSNSGPLMHPDLNQASSISEVDEEGGNAIYESSQSIVAFDCEEDGIAVNVVGIREGNCGGEDPSLPCGGFTSYPNPASNSTALVVVTAPSDGKYKLVNAAGLELTNGDFNAGDNELNINQLPPGIYILTFYGPSRTSSTKIIKQ